MTEQQTVTHCWSCGHPWEAHDSNPDGSRSCRTPGHSRGVPCADCRTMLTPEYREQLQNERNADWFQTVWGAYTITLSDARDAFGDSAPAFFSDIHQSALASALIAYREQQKTAEKRVTALHAPVQHMGQTWCGACSVRRRTGPKTEEWVALIPHPCPTLDALENKEPSA